METKTCPCCGMELFSDMDVCYGCMYDFTREPAGEPAPDPLAMDLDEPDIPRPPDPVPGAVGEAGDTLVLGEGCRLSPRGMSIGLRGNDLEVTIPLPDGGITVGSLPANDVVLHSRAVAGRQLRISPCLGGALVEDGGSENPATLRGRYVSSLAKMTPGDVLDVCGTKITLVCPPVA
jgi:hypothetical protein